MKYLIIIAALLLAGCEYEYKCVDGVIYNRMNETTWHRSGVYAGVPCVSEESKR